MSCSGSEHLRGYKDAVIPAALHDTTEVSVTDAVYSSVAGTLSCHMAGDTAKSRPVTFLFAAGETKRISIRTVRNAGTVTITAADLRLLYA